MGFMSTSAPLVLFLALCWLIHRKRASRLARIPNAHASSPFAAFWIWWIRHTGQEDEVVAALHHRLGPIIRLAPFEISVIGEAVSNNHHMARDLTYGTRISKQGEPKLPTMLESDSHQARYRLLYPVLRHAIRKRRIRAILDEVYIPIIERAATSQLVFDAKDFNDAVMFDIITDLASGGEGRTNNLRDPTIIDKPLRCHRLGLPHISWQQKFVDLVSSLTNCGIYDRTIQHRILANRPLDIHDLGVAGYVAVVQTLTLAMQNLSEHRDVQRCLYKDFRANRALASKMPAGRQKPDLCHNVVIETLRLRGRGPLPRVSPAQWGPFGNLFLPARTQFSIPLYVSHGSPRVFANATQWDPMRWVDTSVDSAGSTEENEEKDGRKSASWSGFGPAVGDDLAMYTLLYALHAVYSRFESENVDGGIRFHHL